jgi:hypothetical protein
MSDQENDKKMQEMAALYYFIEAYAYVTGEHLSDVQPSERPDFICIRETGEKVGVELVRIMRDRKHEQALWDRLLDKRDWAEVQETLDRLFNHADRKEEKRKESDWQVPDSCLLVIQLMDCPLDDFASQVDRSLIADFAALGWQEIWAADFTVVEPFGEVWLFGLYPEKWWGPHPGPRAGTKPYG